MKYDIQKISKITEEIMDFFFTNSAQKINISVENTDHAYIIEVWSCNVKCTEEKIMIFNELLNVQRQREMEEYYWQLAGSDLDGEEYNLVGMMIDEAEVDFKNPELRVKLTRYK